MKNRGGDLFLGENINNMYLFVQELDIMCDGELIPKDHTLKFVYITRWRTKPSPLK